MRDTNKVVVMDGASRGLGSGSGEDARRLERERGKEATPVGKARSLSRVLCGASTAPPSHSIQLQSAAG
jgi:hypothetical protein